MRMIICLAMRDYSNRCAWAAWWWDTEALACAPVL
jgi:hypothetical protein